MKKILCFSLVFCIFIKTGAGGDDHEVEQVKSPFVETRDLGRMMETHGSQHMQRMSSMPHKSFSTYQQQNRLCRTCQYTGAANYGTSGMASHSSSSHAHSGSSSPIHSHPSSSSSRYEMEKKQEFVNGQQVYDFHHEKEYKDGKLINEKRHENSPEEVGRRTQLLPEQVPAYNYGTSSSSSSSSSQTVPYNSYQQGQQYSGSNINYGSQYHDSGVSEFSENFESEVERLREELRRKTLSHSAPGTAVHIPNYGGSHRTEFKTETKYVNGKPVYTRKEERKYKDGKVVHDVVDEKGPEELGTSDAVISHYQAPSKYSGSYSSQYASEFSNTDNSDTAYRPSTYNTDTAYRPSTYNTDTAYRPSTYGSRSEVSSSSSSVTSQQQPYYRPYSSEFAEERKESHRKSSSEYSPDDIHRQPYSSTSYGYSQRRSESGYPVTPSTTTTTEVPRYNYDYSSRRQTPGEDNSYSQHSSSSSSFHSNSGPIYTTKRPYTQAAGSSIIDSTDDVSYPHSPSRSEERIREASQSSYYDSTPNRNRPADRLKVGPVANQIQVVDQSGSPNYTPTGVQSSYYSETKETERKYHIPSHESRITETARHYKPSEHTSSSTSSLEERKYDTSSGYYPSTSSHGSRRDDNTLTQTSRIYQPGSYVASTSTQEEQARRMSSNYYPRTYDSRRPEISNELPEDTETSSGIRYPEHNEPEPGQETDSEEKERYDISPYDDANSFKQPDDETPARRVQFESYPSHHSASAPQQHTTNYAQPDRITSNPQKYYSEQNSERTDKRVTTMVIPPSWVETKTTWKYIDGKLASETQYNRYYENGVLVNEDTIERTRDEMEASGVNVRKFDLSATELAQYGTPRTAKTHSQRHEVYQVKRYRDGQQIYDLHHESLFQDGDLVHENREEKNEDDFRSLPNVPRDHHLTQTGRVNQQESVNRGTYGVYTAGGHHVTQSQQMNQPESVSGGTSGALYTSGYRQTADTNPRSYTKKHEVRQEEEFINGQKVYDLHHERKFEDGRLVHEDKTELGPEELGAQPVVHRDALKDLLAGRTQTSIGLDSLSEQRRTADNILTTSCVTCGAAHGESAHSSKSILSTLALPSNHGHGDASSLRHDVNVEEHYENGRLVKGREEEKKWVDGQLIDENTEHYFQGPSRTNLTASLSSELAASTAVQGSVASTGRLDDECSYNPCRNKGTCKSSVRGPVCICAFGFRGTYCEEAYCPTRYCRYGGTCTISDGTQMCSCIEGYGGYRCSTQSYRARIGVGR